jgi:hypothetical protein
MTLEMLDKLQTQQRHMDILEDRLLDALEQLKTMRQEHELIMQQIVRENR